MENEKIIRQYISATLDKILSEASLTPHFLDRVQDRLERQFVFNVGFESDEIIGKYSKLGTYKLPEDVRIKILKEIAKIESIPYPRGSSFGILLHKFDLNLDTAQFFSDGAKNVAARKLARGKTMVIVDDNSLSNGDMLFAIIRNDIGKTLMLVKSYTKNFQRKLRVDNVKEV